MLKNLICILLMAISIESYGCSCPPIDLKESVNSSDFVYFAQVISAKIVPAKKNEYEHVEATLKIGNVLKGIFDSTTINIKTGMGGGDCGLPLVVPVTYVIFSMKGSDYVGSCSGSRPLNYFATFEDSNDLTSEIKNILTESLKN